MQRLTADVAKIISFAGLHVNSITWFYEFDFGYELFFDLQAFGYAGKQVPRATRYI